MAISVQGDMGARRAAESYRDNASRQLCDCRRALYAAGMISQQQARELSRQWAAAYAATGEAIRNAYWGSSL